MLNGVDPVIIFQLYKQIQNKDNPINIPLTSGTKQKTTFAVIPIYLSEALTGIYVDTEGKNIDIETNTDALSTGEQALVKQNPLGSITTVHLIGVRESVGLTIFLALIEQILDKLVSEEYEITYVNGATTVFGGLIHGFSYDQESNDTRIKMRLELSRGRPKPKSIQVGEKPDAQRLATTGITPGPNAPTINPPPGGAGSSSGSSVIAPGLR